MAHFYKILYLESMEIKNRQKHFMEIAMEIKRIKRNIFLH